MTDTPIVSTQQRHPKLLFASILLAGLIVLGNLGITLFVTNEAQKLLLIDVTYPLWDLWAMLGLGYAAWSAVRQSRRLALAWGCLAAAAGCAGIGNILWAFLELMQGGVPFPSLADVFYLLVYPLFLCGVLLLPTRYAKSSEWRSVMLDMIMVMLTAAIVFWQYVLGPTVASVTQESLLGQMVALAYPVGDLVLFWAVLVLLYRRADRQRVGPILLLTLGMGITIVVDSVYVVQVLRGTYISAGLLDISWVVASLLYGIAGVWQATAGLAVTSPSPRAGASRLNPWFTYLPIACAIGVYLTSEYNQNQAEQTGFTLLTWEVGLILLVFMRQLVMLWENHQQAQTLRQLNETLQAEVGERQQAGEQVQHYIHTLESLNQIHLSLAAELDLDKLVQLVTDVATDLSGAEFGGFFYNHQEQGQDVYLLYTLSGVPREAFAHFPLLRSTAVFGPTFRGEGCIRLADVTQDPRYGHNAPYAGIPAGHLPVRSYLAVPVLTAQGEVIGGLFFGHGQPGVFTEQAEKLVVGIAAQAGVGIQKARLYTQLKEREERFRQLIEDAADGILVGNQAGVCQEANRAICALLGYTREELIGRQLKDLILPANAAQLAAVQAGLQLQQVHVAEWNFVRQDGTPILMEISLKALSTETWQAIVRDITKRKEKEERLRQQDRLAVVGQLAAGMTHDFKNSLSIILLQAQLTLRSSTLSVKERQRLQIIDEQAEHAAHLTGQILDFSRQSILEREVVDLNLFLTDMVDLLKRTIPKQIHIGFTCATQPALVKADVTRLQQVLMNLAINARDAMPQGGKLHIGLSLLNATALPQLPLLEMSPGQWLCIAVSDTGEGIPPEVLPYIFEPFFSTKARDKGTGLGLAQVYGIIQQHGGLMDVTSQPGQGTSFFLYLPALLAPELHDAPIQHTTICPGQGETILVVEDDAALRTIVAEMLQSLNYGVLTAADGQEALQHFAQQRDTIALVLSDLVMPRMDGRQLLQQLHKQDPAVKFIMMSGYPPSESEETVNGQGIAMWLSKPFTVEQVALTIQKALKSVEVTHRTEASHVQYRINERDELVFVNEAWLPFAEANEGIGLEPAAVLQRPLFDFIADATTRLLYRDLLQRVRAGHPVQFPFRCDAPAQRRWLEMTITLTEPAVVEFTTRLLRSEDRASIPLLGITTPRSDTQLRMCSWCQRVEVSHQQWIDLEEAVIHLRLFEQVQLPQLNHGICDGCFAAVKDSLTVA